MKRSELLFTALGYERAPDNIYFNKFVKVENEETVTIKQDHSGNVCMTVDGEIGWFHPEEIEAVDEMCKEFYRGKNE